MIIFSPASLASGQRVEKVTHESVGNYKVLDLTNAAIQSKSLYYIGSIKGKSHVFMTSETSYSTNEDGSIGMPWSHIDSYFLSIEKLTINNGWDLTNMLDDGGFDVAPKDCPKIRLSKGVHIYTIDDEDGDAKILCLGW